MIGTILLGGDYFHFELFSDDPNKDIGLEFMKLHSICQICFRQTSV